MSAGPAPIFVGVDDSAGADAALRWAVDDARACDSPLRLIHIYHRQRIRVNRGPTRVKIGDKMAMPDR